MKLVRLLLVVAATTLLVAGCGEKAEPVAQAEPAAATEPVAAPKPAATDPTGLEIKTGKTRFGRILQDGRGHTIYLFTKEKSKKSRCYGACATAWPPVYTKGTPDASGGGVSQAKLGTTRHGGKRQATYNGHPLYYYVGEDEPNEVLCQAVFEYGGYWYVVNKRGDAIKKSG